MSAAVNVDDKSLTSPKGAPTSDAFPPGIPYIVGNEGAERFSFYGMKAILYVYLSALYLRFVDEGTVSAVEKAAANARATEVVHLFVAGAYAFPLLGAIVADRLFGKYRVILWVSLLYCVGHAVLAAAGRMGALGSFGTAEWAMYLGLGLVAAGAGGIKPCVAANVGDQFTQANAHLVTKVFQIFYFIINYGSFFSTLLTPFLYKTVGPEVAFGVPGVLMGIATFIFWLGRNKFVPVPPNPGGSIGLLDTVATALLFSPFFALIYGYFVRFEHFSLPMGDIVVTRDVVFEYVVGALPAEQAAQIQFGAVLAALAAYFWPLMVGTLAAMGLGVLLFLLRQQKQADDGFLAVLVYAFRHQDERQAGEGFFAPAARRFGDEAAEGPTAVLRIMLVFSMVSVFWALFDQHASTWVAQAGDMNLAMAVPQVVGWYALMATMVLSALAGVWLLLVLSNARVPPKVVKGVLGAAGGGLLLAGIIDLARGEWMSVTLHPAQLSALNPLMVMAIIPGLNLLVYAPLSKRGVAVRPLQKMTVGMFLASTAFGVAALLQRAIEGGEPGSVHALWQFFPYFLMTTAEVLVSITGLEFAYTQAPRRMKSTIMGFWYLCVTFGNLIVAFLAPLQKTYALSQFFWLFAALMVGAAVVFAGLASAYKGKTYLQS